MCLGTMIQLTSDAASISFYYVRPPRVNIQTILSIPNRVGGYNLLHAHHPVHGSINSFLFGLLFVLGPSVIPIARDNCPSTTFRSYDGRRDFNSLVYIPAGRVYCEYKI